MAISKAIRQKVYEKYGEHCAYCGKKFAYKEMQVDHLIPIRQAEEGKADWREVENENNYMPACRRCNHYKRGHSLETFRTMISEIPRKLYRDNYIYKVGEDFEIITAKYNAKIEFFFEKVESRIRANRAKRKWAYKKTAWGNVELWEYIDDIDKARSYFYIREAIDKYGAEKVMPVLMNDVGGYHSAPMEEIIAIVESETKPTLTEQNKYKKIIDNPEFECGWIAPNCTTYSCGYMEHAGMAENICKMFGYAIKKNGIYAPDDTLLELGWVKILNDGHHICLWDKVNDEQAKMIDRLQGKDKPQ